MAAGAEVSGDRVVAVSAAEFSPAVVNTETGYNAGGDSDDVKGGSDPKSDTKMRDFVNMLSKLKLNPLAKEFIPSYLHDRKQNQFPVNKICSADENFGQNGVQSNRRRKNNYYQSNRRLNGRVLKAQREDSIRRTVYVSEIDQTVTEEKLAELFGSKCGHVVDCRICGDPSSRLRFAFVEFADERGAGEALNLCGTVVGFYPIKVLPSKTAILPVNPTFLPRSEDEREMCARTVYCTNIDKQITQADLKSFFESFCGEVSRLRLLGDNVHSTRIAFVEFCVAESAIAALGCCGKLLGTQPIRVSPSKTPVRPRIIRPADN